MYQDPNMLASIRKVEAAREENIKLDPRRMTADEKDALLKKFHPDYRTEQFTELRFGPNKGQKVPLELASLLEGEYIQYRRIIPASAQTMTVSVESTPPEMPTTQWSRPAYSMRFTRPET